MSQARLNSGLVLLLQVTIRMLYHKGLGVIFEHSFFRLELKIACMLRLKYGDHKALEVIETRGFRDSQSVKCLVTLHPDFIN